MYINLFGNRLRSNDLLFNCFDVFFGSVYFATPSNFLANNIFIALKQTTNDKIKTTDYLIIGGVYFGFTDGATDLQNRLIHCYQNDPAPPVDFNELMTIDLLNNINLYFPEYRCVGTFIAVGNTLITGQTLCLPELKPNSGGYPFDTDILWNASNAMDYAKSDPSVEIEYYLNLNENEFCNRENLYGSVYAVGETCCRPSQGGSAKLPVNIKRPHYLDVIDGTLSPNAGLNPYYLANLRFINGRGVVKNGGVFYEPIDSENFAAIPNTTVYLGRQSRYHKRAAKDYGIAPVADTLDLCSVYKVCKTQHKWLHWLQPPTDSKIQLHLAVYFADGSVYDNTEAFTFAYGNYNNVGDPLAAFQVGIGLPQITELLYFFGYNPDNVERIVAEVIWGNDSTQQVSLGIVCEKCCCELEFAFLTSLNVTETLMACNVSNSIFEIQSEFENVDCCENGISNKVQVFNEKRQASVSFDQLVSPSDGCPVADFIAEFLESATVAILENGKYIETIISEPSIENGVFYFSYLYDTKTNAK